MLNKAEISCFEEQQPQIELFLISLWEKLIAIMLCSK
jgi:hypothetical protein